MVNERYLGLVICLRSFSSNQRQVKLPQIVPDARHASLAIKTSERAETMLNTSFLARFRLPGLSTAMIAAATALMAFNASAQTYPNRPIRLLVPFAPGGGSEIVSRAYAAQMSKILGQNVIVENKPGGAGNIAMVDAKGQPADGYTLILGHVGTLAVNPATFAKLPYDAVRDFTPMTLLSRLPNIVAVNPDKVSAKDLKGFIAMAKAKPNSVNYGSAGNGSSGHSAMAYLAQVAGVEMQHVPYKGTGPMLVDLIAGLTEGTFTGAPPLLPQIKAGKLRALAVGSAKRIPALPDVPTVAEQGFPGFETSQWYGILAPAGTPEAIIKKLNEAAVAAGKTPGIAERLSAEAAEPATSTPKEFADFIALEKMRWAEVVKRANIKAD
jgi:tripartite-type tricarboxylate transporter receptor subunit TctC